MVVGHTKFGLDDLARSIAGVYQNKDTFIFGIFMEYVSSCCSGVAYDGEVLRDF